MSTDTTSTAPHPATSPGPRWLRLRRELLIILFLTAFAIAVTWPVVTKMTTEIVGGMGDSHLFYWNYWWFNHALFELKQDPFFCPLQLYPYGADLAFHTLCPFNCLLALPFQKLFGIAFAYNLVILFSLIAAAYTAYRLAFDLTTDRVASVAAGIMFGFCPYLLMRATGHINLVGAWPLPLVVMFAMRAFKTGRFRWAAFAGLFAGLQLWISMYYALFAAIVFFLLMLNQLLFEKARSTRKLLICVLATTAGAVVAAAPIPFLMLRSVQKAGMFFAPPAGKAGRLGADLLSFFVPSHISTVFGHLAEPAYKHLHGGVIEGLAFPGICCLVFAGAAICCARWRAKWLWTALAVLFGIATLGEKLHIYGYDRMMLHRTWVSLPLPMAIADQVPILGFIRASSRFAILVQLALVCLAALGLAHFLKRVSMRSQRVAIGVLFLSLLLDLSVAPYHTSEIKYGRHYEILRDIPGNFSIMHVPFGAGDPIRYFGANVPDTQHWTAAQVVHRRPILGTLIARINPHILRKFEESPLISAIQAAQSGRMTEAILEALTPDVLKEQLEHFNLKVIIAHHTMLGPHACGQLTHLFNHLGFHLLYRDKEVAVIETPLGPSLEKHVPKAD